MRFAIGTQVRFPQSFYRLYTVVAILAHGYRLSVVGYEHITTTARFDQVEVAS
jgi:hypothetical protein